MNQNELGLTGSLDKISIAAKSSTAGMQKLLDILDGLYDNLVLFQSAWEKWENTSFNFRTDEITHQRNLGTISPYDEAMLWKQLMDDASLGWQNNEKAEENYYAKLYEHSKQWIEEQTRLGELSAEETAEAWQRVFDKFDNINIKYEAASNIRSILLGEAEDEISARRSDSDKWMARQDLYDGGNYSRQYEDYLRRISEETSLLKEIESGFLNGVQLGKDQQKQMWLEVYEYIIDLQDKAYLSSKNYLDMQVNDYIEAASKKLQQEYNLKMQQYQDELSSIDKYYDDIEKERRDTERENELDDLLKLKRYYRNAVTKEGQEKYEDIVNRIDELEGEKANEDLESKRQSEKDAVNQKINDAKSEYENAVQKIDDLKEKMADATGEIAKNSSSSAVSIAENIKSITSSITGSVEEIFGSSESRLKEYVTQILSMLQSISKVNNSAISSGNINLTLNDYGNKNLTGKNDVESYGDELIKSFNNSLRSLGVK